MRTPGTLGIGPLLTCAWLTACGGGGTPDAASEWTFVRPAAGTTADYAQTLVDNANNTLHLSERQVVGASDAGGRYTLSRQSLTGQVTVNGTPYGGFTYADQLDGAGHLEARALVAGGTPFTCSYQPPEVLVPFPVTRASTWNASTTATCSDGRTLVYGISDGSVLGPEDLTVGAALFHTLHVRYTVNLQSSAVAYVQHIVLDRWIDTASGMDVRIRQACSYTNGQPSTGYPVSVAFDLVSLSAGG